MDTLRNTEAQLEDDAWAASQRQEMKPFLEGSSQSKWFQAEGRDEGQQLCVTLGNEARPKDRFAIDHSASLEAVGPHLRFASGNTKLLAVMTVYNEEMAEVRGSIEAVATNVNNMLVELKEKGVREADIPEAQDIVLLVVCDGRSKLAESTKTYLHGLGLFSEGDHAEYMTLYQRATYFQHAGTTLQIMVAVKEENAGKLDSHHFAFYSIATLLVPSVITLVDAGTKPATKAIRRLYTEIVRDPAVAGTCGEITVDVNARSSSVLVYAQVFEYKIAHIMEKTLQRMVGYVDVLPGAFSAYRWRALCQREGSKASTPLTHYFKPLTVDPDAPRSPMDDNMALAEDRTLCFWLFVHPTRSNILTYIHAARAETDVPDTLALFIKQRRRWINGAFFALLHTLANIPLIFSSKHGLLRQLLFSLLMLYQIALLILAWVTPALFYLGWFVLVHNSDTFESRAWLLRSLWWCVAAYTIVISMGNPVNKTDTSFTVVSTWFGVLNVLALVCGIGFVADHESPFVQVAGLITLASPVVSTLFGIGHFAHILVGIPSYYFMLPVYMVVLPCYAVCNIHDLTWGTRAGGAIGAAASQAVAESEDAKAIAEEKKKETEDLFRRFRSQFVLGWLVGNGAVIVAFSYFFNVTAKSTGDYWEESDLLTVMLFSTAGLSLLRVACAVLYVIGTRFDRHCWQPCVDRCTPHDLTARCADVAGDTLADGSGAVAGP